MELVVSGDERAPAPGVDLTAYRVIQDALEAAVEQGASRAEVELRYGERDLEVAVRDDRTGGASHRLPGLRDRVGLYGGHLRAGPREREGLRAREQPAADRGGRVRRRINSLTERDWRVIDRVFVGAIVVLGLIELLTLDEPAGVKLGSAAVVSAMAISLLWRRTRPVEMLACLLVLALVGELFFVGPPGSLTQVLILLTATYSVGAHADGRRGFVGLGVGVVGVTALAIVFDPSDIVFPVIFFVVTPWMFGRVLRNTLLTARELAERAELAEHAREEEELRAVMVERNRVARELHDVLAHNLSVVVVQAGAARRIVERDPERAAEVAALIELTGREALAELRHLFGPVRREDGGAHTRAARARRPRAPRGAGPAGRVAGGPSDRR